MGTPWARRTSCARMLAVHRRSTDAAGCSWRPFASPVRQEAGTEKGNEGGTEPSFGFATRAPNTDRRKTWKCRWHRDRRIALGLQTAKIRHWSGPSAPHVHSDAAVIASIAGLLVLSRWDASFSTNPLDPSLGIPRALQAVSSGKKSAAAASGHSRTLSPAGARHRTKDAHRPLPRTASHRGCSPTQCQVCRSVCLLARIWTQWRWAF